MSTPCENCGSDFKVCISCDLYNGKYIEIPDNATNGDIVQMIFPYYSYERNDYVQSTEDYIVDSMECMEHDLYFAYDWWNAPYQKGER